MDILPISSGNPSFIFSHVSPLSVDLYKPLPGPPLITFHGSRPCSHIAAYRMRGLLMSIESSDAPVLSSTYKTFFHVAPPSVDLYRPRSFDLLYKAPCAATKTMFGFFGSTTMREMCWLDSSPIFFHVLP